MDETGGGRPYPFEVTDELIAVESLTVRYGGGGESPPAVENLSFNIFPGEFVCVMGPSGCGKSTILKVLAGFIAPSAGRVKLNHEEIHGVDWHRGVVFQQPALFEWLSVKSNVAFGPRARKLPGGEIRRRVEEHLALVGLAEAADKKVYELSGGMRQRAAIARSLINNPEILLMDEPFGALDALTRAQMQTLLRRIWWNTRKTVFFITHDVDEALRLATRVLVISRPPGRLLRDIGVRFTVEFMENEDERIWFGEDFYNRRQLILRLICEGDGES